jgi:Polyketide cyclase / dehydrase and lipid transport
MSTVAVTISSSLPPDEVLHVLTDFGPDRAKAWAGVDPEHLTVHGSGPDWADVTEGNKVGWERERYSWDSVAGTVSAVTTDSNLWGPGSRWDYKLTPEGAGTKVEVTLQRRGKGIKGKLIGALLPLVGQKMITASVSGALKSRQP